MNKVDANQSEIVKTIRQIGGDWISATEAPGMGCDGIILYHGRSLIAEVKDGSKPPSARKLTPNEVKCKERCEARGVPYLILLSPEQAIETLREFR